jgi:hypothetical protein
MLDWMAGYIATFSLVMPMERKTDEVLGDR